MARRLDGRGYQSVADRPGAKAEILLQIGHRLHVYLDMFQLHVVREHEDIAVAVRPDVPEVQRLAARDQQQLPHRFQRQGGVPILNGPAEGIARLRGRALESPEGVAELPRQTQLELLVARSCKAKLQ
jgi:hypothetical protein